MQGCLHLRCLFCESRIHQERWRFDGGPRTRFDDSRILCSDGGLLSGVPMLKFIALVFSFMRKGPGDLSSSMKSCQTALEDFVKKNPKFPHVNVKVPPVPSADSVFPDTLLARNFAKGKLKRPADQEGCDGSCPVTTKYWFKLNARTILMGLIQRRWKALSQGWNSGSRLHSCSPRN